MERMTRIRSNDPRCANFDMSWEAVKLAQSQTLSSGQSQTQELSKIVTPIRYHVECITAVSTCNCM